MKSENISKTIKSDQEQAVASWINYLNQQRLDTLMSKLSIQKTNLNHALNTLDETLDTITNDIILKNRGSHKGMHGFIAEIAECGIGNARSEILGKAPIYEWINDNGPADLARNGLQIQQKFVNSGNHLSLQAITKHLDTYPWFLENGGKYQIPEDHYKKICYLLSISKEQANKMPTVSGDFSLKQWREVHNFFANGNVKLSDIEPSLLSYDSVQSGTIEQTIANEKKSIKETDKAIKREAYIESKPTLSEGVQVGAISAATEGVLVFSSCIIKKIRTGKSIKDFTSQD